MRVNSPSNKVLSSLPYHICSCLWWWQCGLAAIWIPLSHSICIVIDRSACAAPVLRAATSQCRVTPCRSLSPPISPPSSLPFHPQAESTVSMLSSVSWTVAELTDTDEDWLCVCVCVLSSYRSGTAEKHPCTLASTDMYARIIWITGKIFEEVKMDQDNWKSQFKDYLGDL